MGALKHVAVYRDFVFTKINDAGPDFHAYFGDVLGAIDNLVDRSPVWPPAHRRRRAAQRHPLQLEDGAGEHQRHRAPDVGTRVGDAGGGCTVARSADDAPKPMAMEQILPFGAGHDFFDRMGGRVYPNGHSMLGTNFSIHSGYAQVPEYEAALRAAHGDARASEIPAARAAELGVFSEPVVKGSPQAIRVIRPLAADRTLLRPGAFASRAHPICCSSAR